MAKRIPDWIVLDDALNRVFHAVEYEVTGYELNIEVDDFVPAEIAELRRAYKKIEQIVEREIAKRKRER